MTAFSKRFFVCAIAYVVAGMALGLHMGSSQNFTMAPLHAHMNLVGWATMGLFAFYYNAVPTAAAGKLPQAHFWIAQIGLLLMIPGLAMVLSENMSGEPLLVAGEMLTGVSMLIFGYIVLRNPSTQENHSAS